MDDTSEFKISRKQTDNVEVTAKGAIIVYCVKEDLMTNLMSIAKQCHPTAPLRESTTESPFTQEVAHEKEKRHLR